MKVLLLGGANSIHTLRWANGLAGKGVEVHLASIHPLQDELDSAVKFYRLPYSSPAGYVLAAPCLKRLLKKIKPDLMNAHYATGYGLLARLSGFKPTLLSVWGSDVYEFPKKSLIHK